LVPRAAESYKVGSVSISMRYFPDGKYTDSAFSQAVVAARAALEESTDLFGFNLWDTAYGSSGTAGAVAELLRANNITNGVVTREALAWAQAQLAAAGQVDKLKLLGLKDDRKPVLAGGLAVITALFDTFNLTELQSAKGALRQGVMFDIVGREQDGRDLRNDSVNTLQARFTIDSEQANRIAQLAQNNLLQILPDASPALQRELRWAAQLHELGMTVSHSEYHKHGAYIIANADAAGFSQPQQARLAALVEGHRGRVKKVDAFLTESAFAAQLLALRIAAIVCHARRAPDAGGLKLKRTAAGFSIHLRSTWAEAHPQTVFLLNEEVQAWRKAPFTLELVD
jgi:exopolyphosphatase / guanosine-5'-triphosphate,3'-diphosphate pyrophosphatase